MATETLTLKYFVLNWGFGNTEIVKGYSISDAFMKAGYGGGAIRALDSYKEISEEEASEMEKK